MCVCEKKRIERGKFFDYEGCCGCCLNASRWPSSRPTPSHGLIRSVWFSLSFGCFLFWLYTLYWCMVFSFAEMWLYEEILEFFFFFFGLGGYQSSSSSFCRLFYFLAALIPYSCHLSIRILNIFEKGKAKILYQKMAYVDCFTMLHFFPFFANRIS